MQCRNPRCKVGEIIRDQYGRESDEDFKAREDSGFCRSKCRRLAGPLPKDRPIPPLSPVSWHTERTEGVAVPKEVAEVDEKYRKFVRAKPCLIPHCGNASIFHHQPKRKHGKKGGLCSDYRGLNLCEWHHTLGGTPALPGSYHGLCRLTGWKFWEYYGIDVEAVILSHNEEFNRIQADKRRK